MSTIQDLQTTLTTAQTAFQAASAALDTANTARLNALQTLQTAQSAYDTAVAQGIQSGTVGTISSVTALLVTERNAGIQGAATCLKANPSAAEADVMAAWTASGIAATSLPALLQDPTLLFSLYSQNLHAAGAIPDTTWASVAAWVVATPIEQILAD